MAMSDNINESESAEEQNSQQGEQGRDGNKYFTLRLPAALHAKVAYLCNNLLPGRVSMNDLMIAAIERHVSELERALADDPPVVEEKVTLNIEMSEDLHTRFRIRVSNENTDVDTVIVQMISDYLSGRWRPEATN
jgi:hypothetical protein